MVTRFYTPHILLQNFISCIMIVDATVDNEASVCPYPPTPQNSLFFYIGDRISMQQNGQGEFVEQARSVVVGPQLTRVTLDIKKRHKAVRVGFQPGGLHRLLGIPLKEIVDASFDAAVVFGNEMNEINERLQYATEYDEIRYIIEDFLLKKCQKLKPELPFDRAMEEILRHNGTISMDRIAGLACLSIRQFERVSIERIGFSPKLFARLTRFSRAYRLRENFPELSWTHIAYECGYFDQMHFIRDFKQFAGVTPRFIEKELRLTPVLLQASLRL